MAATKTQINWSAVSFTPAGGSLTTIDKVLNVTIDMGVQNASFSGDADRFPTTVANTMNRPRVTIRTGNPAVTIAFAGGTTGALAATHNDSKLATGGAIVYAIANAVVSGNGTGGQHAQFGDGTISFECFSSDGTTNPISFTRT